MLRLSSPPPTPGAGKLLLDVDGLSLTVALDFRWREHSWPHVSDHGKVTATVSDGHIARALWLPGRRAAASESCCWEEELRAV